MIYPGDSTVFLFVIRPTASDGKRQSPWTFPLSHDVLGRALQHGEVT